MMCRGQGTDEGTSQASSSRAASATVSDGLPKGIRTGDYIFARKNICKLFDLKTISGDNSVGNRLKESIGQTNRVLLNMATTYNPRILAQDIKDYFTDNPDAREVLIFKGKREISITNDLIKKNFIKFFLKVYGK